MIPPFESPVNSLQKSYFSKFFGLTGSFQIWHIYKKTWICDLRLYLNPAAFYDPDQKKSKKHFFGLLQPICGWFKPKIEGANPKSSLT